MLMQLVIRARLLYDLSELVNRRTDTGTLRRIETLARWITRNDYWHIHRDIVFRNHKSYRKNFAKLQPYEQGRDSDSRWIRVHYKDYFPVDCWCIDAGQFKRWFALVNRPEISVDFQRGQLNTRTLEWSGDYEVGIRNFHIFGFNTIVRVYFFLLEGDYSRDLHNIRAGQDIVPRRGERGRLGTAIRETIERIIDCGGNLGCLARACRGHDGLVKMPDPRSSEQTASVTFHFGTKTYLLIVCTNVGDTAVLSRVYLVSKPLGSLPRNTITQAEPRVYEIKGPHLIRGDRRSRFM